MNCNDSMINNSMLKKMNDPGRNFQILAISNRHLCNQPFEDQIKRVCEWHPDALVLREKDLPEDEYKALAKNILDICKAYDVPCILHTYWKAALELGHDAIHLPLPLLRELSAAHHQCGHEFAGNVKLKLPLFHSIFASSQASLHSSNTMNRALSSNVFTWYSEVFCICAISFVW